MLATKQPFVACGKLTPMFNEPSRNTRSARMSFDKVVAFHHDVSIA